MNTRIKMEIHLHTITKKSIIYKIFAWIEKFLYKKADKIVTLMPGAFLYIEKLGILKDKIEWISNGVDLEKFDEDSEKEPIYKFDKDKINFLYTGSIGIANALDEIFEVAKLLKEDREIVFNFIGDGPLKEKYIRFCEENKLDNIRFYPVVSKDNIPSLLKQADILMIFVKKSNLYKYGISLNKLFEYLASSKPIIFSGDVYNDIVKIANAGISVNAENIEKIMNSVLLMKKKSKNERNIFGEHGRIYLERNFISGILVKKIEQIIEA
jgi:glycosyltransferase involved in cell wall biosynthesis